MSEHIILCGFPSSVSDATCILPVDHPADGLERFHSFTVTGGSATEAAELREADRAWNSWRSTHRGERYGPGDTFLGGYIEGLRASRAGAEGDAGARVIETRGADPIATLYWLQAAMEWAVFKDAPRVNHSNEMRDIRERIDAALSAEPVNRWAAFTNEELQALHNDLGAGPLETELWDALRSRYPTAATPVQNWTCRHCKLGYHNECKGTLG